MGKKERQKSKVLLCIVGILSFFAVLGLFPTPAKATTGINQELSFEGKIVNASGINITDGTYNVEFKIYAGGSGSGGGTLKWTEDELVHNSQAVTFTSGTFQVNLGAVTAFGGSIDWNSNPLYLSIQIGNTSNCTVTTTFQSNCGGDGEMTPYILLTATPYAMNSNQLGGLTAAQFLQLAPGSAQVDSSTASSAFINKTGASGNILELQKSGTDVATIGNTGSVTLQNSVDSTTALNVIGHTSGLSVFDVDTTNGRVGIGTATPATNLDVANATANNTGTYALQVKQNNASSLGAYIFVNHQSSTLDALNVQGWNGTTVVKGLDVKGNGSVGIGTTTPGYPLDILGTANASTSLLTPLLDTASGVALNIGTTSATAINLNQNTTVATNKSITANGLALFKDATNANNAFQVQNSSGANLLTADTTNGNIVLGNDATPAALIVRGGAATGTNAAGANITFNASNGTGTGGSGALIFQTAAPSVATPTDDGNDSTSGGATATLTYSHTVANQPNRVLIVGVADNDKTKTVNTVTYAGINLSKLDSGSSNMQADCTTRSATCHVELWYLAASAVPVGTANVVVTLSGSASVQSGASTYYNVDQTSPVGVFTGGSGQANPSAISVASNTTQLVVDIFVDNNVITAPSAGQTQRYLSSTTYPIGSSTKPGTASTTSLGWSDTSSDWATVGVALNPPSGTGADSLQDRLHISANGNVGINNTAPAFALDVSGTGNFTTSLQAPLLDTATAVALNLGTTNATGINLNQNTAIATGKTLKVLGHSSFGSGGNPATNTTLVLDDTITSPSGNATGISDILRVAPTASDGNFHSGAIIQVQSPAGNVQNFTGGFRGATIFAQHNGTGTLAQGWGAEVRVDNLSTGTITDATALRVSSIVNSGGGTITTAYGINIANQTAGLTNYAINTGTGTVRFGDIVQGTSYDTVSASALNLGPTNATSVNLSQNTTITAGKNFTFTSGAGNFDQSASTGTFATGTGTVSLNGNTTIATNKSLTANGAALFQDATNSSTAFQIQNAAAAPVFLVDTTSTMANGNQLNYLKYPGFESGSFSNAAAGWAAVAPGTLSQNTNKVHTYNGIFSAQIVTTASNGGLSTTSFASAPPSGTYLISFYAKVSSGTMASTAFTAQTTDGATHTCSPASGVTINANGFQRLFCSITATGAITALQITQNDSTARTIYIDSVQLQSNSYDGVTITAPTAYNVGNIQLRGTITNPLTIATNGDSTSAFQVQNASGASVFTVDTLNGRIGIGTTTPTDAISIPAANASIAMGSGAGSQINMTGSPTSSSVFSLYGSSTETILNGPSGGDVALKIGNSTKVFLNSSGQLGLAGNTSPGASLDIGSGTIQGAGLSSDCSTSFSKLLWSSSSKQFSCGTDRTSYTITKASDQTVATTTLADVTNMAVPIGASETWIFFMNLGANQSVAADGYKFAMTSPAGSTCNYSTFANNKSTVSSDAKDACNGTGIQWGASGQAAGDDFTFTGIIVNSTTAGNVQLRFADWTSTGTVTAYSGTSYALGYKVSGADLAEIYYTDDQTMKPGDVVAIDPSKPASVKKTDSAYQSSAMGIVSTQPGSVLGAADGTGLPEPIALSGRVPVKVSTINGPIAPGDYLTASSIPGVAMKATRPGQMIAKSLTGYNNSDPNAIGTAIGFVDLTWADPGYDTTAGGKLQGSDSSTVATLANTVSNLQGQMDTTANKLDQLSSQAARLDQPNSFTGTSEHQFQIQNSQNAVLLNADTKNMVLTVANLTVSGTLALNGHVLVNGDSPTTKILPAAGVDTNGSNDATCSITGNDTNGTVTLVAGTTHMANGPECTITFAKPFSSAPQPVFSPINQEGVDAGLYISATPETMTLNFNHAPETHHSYSFNYWNPQ